VVEVEAALGLIQEEVKSTEAGPVAVEVLVDIWYQPVLV
jgi:hypothetical protein